MGEQDGAPQGYYLADEAGALAGVSGDRIGQWARRGYIRSSVSDRIPRVYSYQDVAEAMVVHELLDRGVLLAKIKRAIAVLRSDYGAWPLSAAPIATLADRGARGRPAAALVLEQSRGLSDLGRDPLQGVLEAGDLRRIASQLRRGGWVVREHPDLKSIEVDPDRLSGRPVIRGTRVPAELVARMAGTEEGRRILRGDYDISASQIDDAVLWWEAVLAVAA